jgi:phage-related protein
MPDADLQITFAADASGLVRGAQQAQAAVADFGPRIEAIGKSLSELADRAKGGFDGVKGLGEGLRTASASGAEGLAGLAEAAGGVVGVAGAVAEVAASAAGAIADWAEKTATSTAASAEARENATNLNTALGQANQTFGEAGGILANAFAPALTQLVTGLTNLVRGFVDSYNHGTVLKTGLDWLVIGVSATFGPIKALGEGFRDAWIVIRGVWATMSQAWSKVQTMFSVGVGAIQRLFASLGETMSDAFSGNWAAAVQSAMKGAAGIAQGVAKEAASAKGLVASFAIGVQTTASALASPDGPQTSGTASPTSHPHDQNRAAHRTHRSPTPSPAPSANDGCSAQTSGDACAQNLAALDACHHTEQGLNAASLDTKKSAEKQTQDELTQANADGNAKRAQQDRAAAETFRRTWDSAVRPLVSSFANGLLQMAEGTKSFAQVIRGLGQQILHAWVGAVTKMVSEWARGMVQHIALTNTTNAAVTASNQAAANTNLLITLQTNMKKAASDAVTAAKGAYAWGAGWGGPIAGAIAAAAALAGVMALGAVASAEGGYDVPAGVNPMTQLHQQEMVLPARLANPLRQMVADYGSNGAGAALGGSGGDTHVHNWTVQTLDGPSLLNYMRANKQHFQTVLGEIVRGGGASRMGLATA